MNQLQQNSNDLLQEEIRRAIREKLSKFTFPCPHCREDISDDHFGKEQRAFGYINEVVRKALEEQIIPQWNRYKLSIVKELEKEKIYENFPDFKELKSILKDYEQKVIYLQSPEHIENSTRVKKLEEENKEIANKNWKALESLQNQNQELQKELSEKKEQIQNLVLRQKGQAKGQDFEKWFHEELLKVFDGQDRIIDVSKGQAGMGKRADFLQEVLVDNNSEKVVGKIVYETKNVEKWDNSWVEKLEKDMVFHQADYGFIFATCEGDKIIRSAKTTDPRKKIYISGDNNNLFLAIKTIRELLITKHNLTSNNNSTDKEQKLKKMEEWANEKLPEYTFNLQVQFEGQEKAIETITKGVEKIKNSKDKITKLVMNNIKEELRKILN
ncbi:MAG: hypothetical protein mread185_000690 [Mycoplasmataceae bacterium]|nr:MAG: hypothetical protein mread185_000690 [Mycoplasmataceae bacterium]